MSKIFNPFEYLTNAKAFGWGFLGVALSLGMILLCGGLHAYSPHAILELLSGSVLLWLPLSTLLYVAALLFSPSRIRAVDIYSMVLFALLPSMIMFGFSNAVSQLLQLANIADPRTVAGVLQNVVYNLLIIMLSVSMVWSMVWGCFAYAVSANIKGGRGIAIFIACFVCVSVAIQLLLFYF